MKKIWILLITCFVAFSLAGCKKQDNLSSLSANLSNYTIDIELDTYNKKAEVKQTVDYINSSTDALDEIKFHLYPQFFKQDCIDHVVSSTKLNDAFPNGMDYSNFEVTRVLVNKQESSVNYEGEYSDILRVDLNNSLLPEERVEISIEFNFTIPNCEHRFGYGNNTINLANFYPIACVYENGEFNTSPYNSNGDPFYSDMANYCVNICLDELYIVAGTGVKTAENIVENKKNLTFEAELVRDFALVASNKFEVISEQVDNTLVEYYYYNDENAQASLKSGVDSIKTFSKLFGAYPYKTLSIVKTDFIYGGMEYPNLIMISGDIENHDDYMNVIIHETAHQWWYGIVGNDEFKYPWLDEALTEYSTLLFYDHNKDYNFTHKELVDINKSNYSLFVSVYEEVLGSLDTSMRAVNEYSTDPEYTYCTYVKGVLMYESLYQLIGEKAFTKGLQTYFENNKYTNAIPEDLILAFKNATNKDMHNFFSSWIEGKVVIH